MDVRLRAIAGVGWAFVRPAGAPGMVGALLDPTAHDQGPPPGDSERPGAGVPAGGGLRRFVVVGRRAHVGPDLSLTNLPASGGRLDVLLRCLRAALLVSHGVRRDVVVYLVLLGEPAAPRTLRVDGATVKFLRPDERSLAVLVQKSFAAPRSGAGFVTVRPGIAIADGGLDLVLADVGAEALYALQEGATDLRCAPVDPGGAVFFLGDDMGFDEATRAWLSTRGATPVGVGPVSLHADDAVAVVLNELDRRGSAPPPGTPHALA